MDQDFSTPRARAPLAPIQAGYSLAFRPTSGHLSTRLAGTAFLLGGSALAAALLIEFALSHGAVIPRIIFRMMHWQAPVTLALAAGAGWALSGSRVARWLSGITVGFLAFRMTAERYGLPRLDGTLPRMLLALGLIAGGLYFAFGRASTPRSLTSA